MRVLVTGGCGFIGSHVVDWLLRENHEALVVDDFSTGKRENLVRGVEVRTCSIVQESALRSCFEEFKPQAVLHLAAQASISESERDPRRDLAINGGGTINLLRLCQEFEVRRFVFASTSAVYANQTRRVLTEGGSRISPESPYGISKWTAETYIRLLMPGAVILRLANVYGPRQIPIGENQVIARMIRHFKYADPFFIFGDGKQERDFVYVEDAARAFGLALRGDGGVYNIASGESLSVNETARRLAQEWGFPGYVWKHDESRVDDRRRVSMDIFMADRELYWKPQVSLQEGIKRTIEWWNRGESEKKK